MRLRIEITFGLPLIGPVLQMGLRVFLADLACGTALRTPPRGQ